MDHARHHAARYFSAWNQHDAGGIASSFAPRGTYSDPILQEADAEATARYAQELWEAFPDLRFEPIGEMVSDGTVLASQWLMKGTHRGAFRSLAPTGRAIVLPGADIIRAGAAGIETVTGYFDPARIRD